jgi:hypothetical protein
MNTYPPIFGQNQPQSLPYQQIQQIQQMFPQPQGSVYSINTPVEVGNVPIGSTGLSVAICLPEQLMYIKSFQNGNPVIMAYRVSPYTKEEIPTETAPTPTNEATLDEKVDRLEKMLTALVSKGGKFDGLL